MCVCRVEGRKGSTVILSSYPSVRGILCTSSYFDVHSALISSHLAVTPAVFLPPYVCRFPPPLFFSRSRIHFAFLAVLFLVNSPPHIPLSFSPRTLCIYLCRLGTQATKAPFQTDYFGHVPVWFFFSPPPSSVTLPSFTLHAD